MQSVSLIVLFPASMYYALYLSIRFSTALEFTGIPFVLQILHPEPYILNPEPRSKPFDFNLFESLEAHLRNIASHSAALLRAFQCAETPTLLVQRFLGPLHCQKVRVVDADAFKASDAGHLPTIKTCQNPCLSSVQVPIFLVLLFAQVVWTKMN